MGTGALLPCPLTRPISVICSLLVLTAAIWANHHKEGKLEMGESIRFRLFFLAGAIGRLLTPKLYIVLRLLHYLGVIDVGSQAKQCPACWNTYHVTHDSRAPGSPQSLCT